MSVIIDTTRSELEALIKYARYGANNCMIANSWEVTELVRCKDCVYGRPYNKVWYQPKKDSFYCLKNEAEKDENWFCADGKKVTK